MVYSLLPLKRVIHPTRTIALHNLIKGTRVGQYNTKGTNMASFSVAKNAWSANCFLQTKRIYGTKRSPLLSDHQFPMKQTIHFSPAQRIPLHDWDSDLGRKA